MQNSSTPRTGLPHHFRLYYTSSKFHADRRVNRHPEHYEINWGLGGENRYRVGGERHRLTRHRLLVIGRGQAHEYESERPYEVCSILFTRTFLEPTLVERLFAIDLLEGLGPTRAFDFSRSAYAAARVDQLFRLMLHEPRDTARSWLAVRGALGELALFLLEYAERKPTAAPLEAVLDEVHRRYFEPLDLRGLAQRHGIPYASLSTRFRKKTGVTYTRYVQRLRLEHSARLLRDEGYPVTGAAFEAGFVDLANFHRAFKARYGMTPAAYGKGKALPPATTTP